jgi:hypothetical protein
MSVSPALNGLAGCSETIDGRCSVVRAVFTRRRRACNIGATV